MREDHTPVGSPVDWTRELTRLDAGEYAAAVARLRQDAPDDTPEHRLWRAEVLLHEDRLDDARAELAAVVEWPASIRARAALVEAECDLWDSATVHAEETARAVAMAGDCSRTEYARAVAMLARAAVRRGDYREARERLAEAVPIVSRAGLDHMVAVMANAEGFCRMRLGRDEAAGAGFEFAIGEFRRMRDTRWEAIARSTYGVWLDEVDRTDEAIAQQTEALRLAGKHGYEREAITARHNLAQIYLAAGRVTEAVEMLEVLGSEERSGRYGSVEAHGLCALALASVLQGNTAEVLRVAESALFVAETVGETQMAYEAKMMRAWARAREGDSLSLATLRLMRADQTATTDQLARLALYLADVVAADRPDEADALYREAAERARGDRTTENLAALVGRRLRAHPVHVAEPGQLVIDVRRRGFPSRRAAHEALDRFLVAEALRVSALQIDAARLLGETKGNFSKLCARLQPDRGRAGRA